MYTRSLSEDSEKFNKIMGDVHDTSSYNAVNQEFGKGFMDVGDIDINDIVNKGKVVNDAFDLTSLQESVNSAFSSPPNIMDDFLNVPAIKQETFVGSKIAPKADVKTVDKNAEKAMTEAKKYADLNKKWMDTCKKQELLCESVAKFECLIKDIVENIADEGTKPVMEALHKAYKDSVCSKI